jgi:double-stranded uracil-DNA glycosylase
VPLVRSFAPIARRDARVLILGSMPGTASLAAGRYYAHPRNAFWPIVGELCGVAATAAYATRLRALQAAGIAVWDVLQCCEREGSLDGDIAPATARPNDFATFFTRHPQLVVVACNGGTAWSLFARVAAAAAADGAAWAQLPRLRLPSTSPAHAARSLAEKAAAWRDALTPYLP